MKNSIDGVLGIRTQDRINESMELWQLVYWL